MDCPQGWLCNEDCAYYLGIDKCDYVEDTVDLKEIAVKIEQETVQKAKQDAEKIKMKSDPQTLINADSHEVWRWWGVSSPPDALIQKEPINSMSGAIEKGGGSNNNRRKQPTKKAPEYLKTWGL